LGFRPALLGLQQQVERHAADLMDRRHGFHIVFSGVPAIEVRLRRAISQIEISDRLP
jgi:hypothetical protein